MSQYLDLVIPKIKKGLANNVDLFSSEAHLLLKIKSNTAYTITYSNLYIYMNSNVNLNPSLNPNLNRIHRII